MYELQEFSGIFLGWLTICQLPKREYAITERDFLASKTGRQYRVLFGGAVID